MHSKLLKTLCLILFFALPIYARMIIVQPGDTLWKIAERELGNGNRFKEIAEWNNLQAPYKITAGENIEIKDSADSSQIQKPESNSSAESSASMQHSTLETTAVSPLISSSFRSETNISKSLTKISELLSNQKTFSISLKDAIDIARRNNLSLLYGELSPDLSRSALESLKSEFDPSLSASLEENSQRTTNTSSNKFTDEKGFDWKTSVSQKLPIGTSYDISLSGSRTSSSQTYSSSSSLNPLNTSEADLTLTQPLLEGFGRRATYSSVDAGTQTLASSIANARRLQEETDLNIANAYWALAEAEAVEKTALHSLEIALELLRKNEGKAERGLISNLEVTTARSGVASREESLITAVTARQNAAETLLFLIHGASAPAIAALPTAVSKPKETLENISLEELESRALEIRKDLIAKKAELEKSEILLGASRNSLLPSLDATGSIGTGGRAGNFSNSFDNLLNNDEPSWSAGLVFTVPIGNRSDRAKHKKALIELEQAKLALQDAENKIRQEVRSQYRGLMQGQERLYYARQSQMLADERLRGEYDKYELGLSDTLRVLDAEEDATQAKLTELKSLYGLAEAYAKLMSAIGNTEKIRESEE